MTFPVFQLTKNSTTSGSLRRKFFVVPLLLELATTQKNTKQSSLARFLQSLQTVATPLRLAYALTGIQVLRYHFPLRPFLGRHDNSRSSPPVMDGHDDIITGENEVEQNESVSITTRHTGLAPEPSADPTTVPPSAPAEMVQALERKVRQLEQEAHQRRQESPPERERIRRALDGLDAGRTAVQEAA